MKRKEMKLNRFLLLFSLSVVTLMLLLIGFVLYQKTVHYIDEKTDAIQTMKLNQTATDVRKQFEDMHQTINSLRNNTLFIQTLDKLERQQTTSYEKVSLSRNLESSLSNLKKGNELIHAISIWTQAGQYSSNTEYASYYFEGNRLALPNPDNDIRFVAFNQTYAAFGLKPDDIQDAALRALLDAWNNTSYLMCPINGPEATLGILTINLQAEAFNHMVPNGESLAFLDSMNQVLFKGGEFAEDIGARLGQMDASELTDGVLLAGKRYFLRDIGFHDLRIVLAEPESGFHRKQLFALGGNSLIILCGSALLTLFLSHLIARKILFPLHSLISWIGRQRTLEQRWEPLEDKRMQSRRFTMRDRFFVYLLVTILLPVCLFVTVFYVQSSRIFKQELEETFHTLFDKTAHRVELFADQKETAMTRLAYDSFVVSYVGQADDHLQQQMDQLIYDSFLPVLKDDAIGIYNVQNELIYSNRYKHASRMEPEFFKQLSTERKNIFYWLPPAERASSTVSLGIGIVDINRYSSPMAYMKTDINGVFFTNLYADLNENGGEAFIVDDGGRIVSHPDVAQIGHYADLPASLLTGKDELLRMDHAMYYARKLTSLPWYVVARYDVSAIEDQVIRLFFDDIYLLVILFLLILICSYVMSQYLVQPLVSLHDRYPGPELDHVNQLVLPKAFAIDEVEQLRVSFNYMLERIHKLVEDTLESNREKLTLEFEKKELHMEALQAQINPHFLYNTLETIMYMIEEGERHLAVDMIGLLSRLFRYAMGKDSPLTTLREEIAYCKNYSKIMSYRYKDRIQLDWQTDEAALDNIVNKMILQPVIENAIRHTLKAPDSRVAIRVSATRSEDGIELTVTDNGPGIAPDKLNEIRLRFENRERKNVGLYNVNSRIKLHFGDAYGLSIESPGAGTIVTLKLPCRKKHILEAPTK